MFHLQKTSPGGVAIAAAAHGLGLFAIQNFSRGQFVGWMEGHLVHDEAYSSDYCVDLGDGRALEPGAPFRYLNHSCEPNCELYVIETDADGVPLALPRVAIETMRSIACWEELTIDYGWPAEDAIPCGCGAEECRGWVVAEDEVHLLSDKPRRTAI